MAWLGNWFSKKNPGNVDSSSETVFFEQMDMAKSAVAGSRREPSGSAAKHQSGNTGSERKNIRLELRELLFGVVRESMARLGQPTANYKYKVLSLDSHGRQYMIMMDLKQDLASQSRLMLQAERLITHEAKVQNDIQVAGIYWRGSEQSSVVASEAVQPAAIPVADSKPKAAASARPVKSHEEAKLALSKAFSQPSLHPVATPSAFPDTQVFDH